MSSRLLLHFVLPRNLFGRLAAALLLATLAASAGAASAAPLQQPAAPGSAREAIEQFLTAQTAGLSGQVSISVDAQMAAALPPCAMPEPFLPASTRLWGRVSVGVRCGAEQPWTRYVSSHISVLGVYYVAARQINAGQAVTLADVQPREGDLTAVAGSVIVDPAQFNGATASSRIAAGAPLRRESLRATAVVQQGQTVKVVTQGSGFMVSTEGRAMSNAPAGALIQVKIQGGQMLSGIVRADGIVERPP
ncbi:MAG: flagellar basal body P-ring formation chaperone FlgA [Rhodoferax sp.]